MLLIFTINAKAQVTLEHTYDSAGYYGYGGIWQQLYVVKLEVDGDKFVFVDKANKAVKFYNLNHTLWKTVSFAAATDFNPSQYFQNIAYISQHLFDTDDEIEFLYVDYTNGSSSAAITEIINEDGSILFTANNQAPFLNASVPQAQVPIYNTSNGTKMILSGGVSTDGNAYVYGLAGTLMAGIKGFTNNEQDNFKMALAYPNLASTSTKIAYKLPNGVNTGQIVFYDTQGKEVKRFTVDNTFSSIEISTEDLQSGIYYYNLQTAQGNSGAKKLVTVK